MAIVRFDSKSFIDSCEPGIVTLVAKALEKELEVECNKVIETVISKLKQELPDIIKARVYSAMNTGEFHDDVRIEVVIDWRKKDE